MSPSAFTHGRDAVRASAIAVNDVSFTLETGRPEIFTIIGESGSGKTTLARMILGLERPSAGSHPFQGEDLSTGGGAARRGWPSCAKVQPVFQNPFEAFNPLKRVDRYLRSTARRFLEVPAKRKSTRAMDEALVKVGLSLAEVPGAFRTSCRAASCSASPSRGR
jgi:ABC-type glutathione transport system ATPase component